LTASNRLGAMSAKPERAGHVCKAVSTEFREHTDLRPTIESHDAPGFAIDRNPVQRFRIAGRR